MKWLLFFMMVVMTVTAKAETTYVGTIDDEPLAVTFTPGPFGPGEQGTANVVFSGNKQTFDYNMVKTGDVLFYEITGLCTLIGTDNQVDVYQPLGVELTRKIEKPHIEPTH